MQFSAHVLDEMIAPKLSLLTSCGARDVPQMPNHHIALVLNQAITPIYPERVKILTLNFIRHIQAATAEYRNGRDSLSHYVSMLPDHGIGRYTRALAHFEDCVLNAYIAVVCLDGVGAVLRETNPSVPRVFTPGDQSDYDRLRQLNNRIKHFDEDVAKAVEGHSRVPVAPVWITDTGLETPRHFLHFDELAEILVAQAKDAEDFSVDFFREAAERRKSKQKIDKP